MDSAAPLQRRRPHKTSTPPTTPSLLPSSPRLRKANTAHARSSALNDMIDFVADSTFIPKRSPTSSKALEALVRQPRAHIVDLLEKTDRVLAGLTDASSLIDANVWAVPNVLLEHTTAVPPHGDNDDDDEHDSNLDLMDVDHKKPTHSPVNHHHHESDSGLGTSISTSPSSTGSSGAAINRSFTSTTDSNVDTARPLSDFAAKEIKAHILDPLLAQEALSDFYPLLRDVPRRIGAKEIKNLRDLEKNLLLLAYDTAPSAKSYEQFCSQAITCILATVNDLPEEDRQLPADRPFTNSYALDLIDQIRRYAQIMADTRAREAEGKPAQEKDYSPDEEIIVQGGLSHDGTPAQLIRKKANGDTIPLASRAEIEAIEKASPLKRSFDDHDDDDEDYSDTDAMRSMARRRKSDRPGDVEHKCRDCDKKFKRPCDLTKHEKTHSRPWKCPDASCRYHTEGWPTEKEMERHHNDRHNSAPKMYKCSYDGCAYTSKRESNCKQHMEKSHGYVYKRSKANRRARGSVSGFAASGGTPSTPLTPFTPASNHFATPITPFAPSPAMANFGDFGFVAGQPTPMMAPYDFPLVDTNTRRQSNATVNSSALTFSTNPSPHEPSFEQSITPHDVLFDTSLNMNMNINMDIDMAASAGDLMFQNPPTPASAPMPPFDFNAPMPEVNADAGTGQRLHLSPLGSGHVTLLSQPDILVDEAFFDDSFRPPVGSDFTLFESTSNGLPGGTMFGYDSSSHDFPEASMFGNAGGVADNNNGDATADLFGDPSTSYGMGDFAGL